VSLHETGRSVSALALPIRTVLPRHTTKLLARLMDLNPETARRWLYYGPARHRRRELATALLAEMDRQDVEERAEARAAWREITEGG
jgi:hypothetical protein